MQNDASAKGKEILASKYEKADIELIEKLRQLSPDFAAIIMDFAFGKIWAREVLSTRNKEIATVAALITTGSVGLELKGHFHTALNIGLTREELIEVIILMTVYVGIPKCINAMLLLHEVLEERSMR